MSTAPELTPYRYRILRRVRDYAAAERNQMLGLSPFMVTAYDWLEERGLIQSRPVERLAKIGIASSEYVPTESGLSILDAMAADGRLDRTLTQQSRIRAFLRLFDDYSVGIANGDVLSLDVCRRSVRYDSAYPSSSARLRYDEDAYAEAGRLIGSNVIRLAKHVEVLVLQDSAKVLPSGEVLHEVKGIEHSWKRGPRPNPEIQTIFLMRSILDDVWISAPTERAVKLRFKKHVPIMPKLTAPAPRTAEDDIEDAAIGAGF